MDSGRDENGELLGKRKKKSMSTDLAFIDIETTGTGLNFHDLGEVAIVRDNRLGETIAEWSGMVKLNDWQWGRADPAALKVNGLLERRSNEARPLDEILIKTAELLDGATLVGHNIQYFDIPFLRNLMRIRQHEILECNWEWYLHPYIDTMVLARSRWPDKKKVSHSLNWCCERFNIEPEGIHMAMGGASRVRALYYKMLGRSL